MSLPSLEKMFVIQAVAGRRHKEWLHGRPFGNPALIGGNIRMLENGTVGLVFALYESEERVRLLAILRNSPA